MICKYLPYWLTTLTNTIIIYLIRLRNLYFIIKWMLKFKLINKKLNKKIFITTNYLTQSTHPQKLNKKKF
jgi:hypothetical protein